MADTLSVDKFNLVREPITYIASADELTKVSYIKSRFIKMQQARTIIDRNRETYQTMINAYFVPYPDERSSSTVPLASAIIELYVAEAMKIETIFQFKWETSKHWTNAKALEYVRKYDWRRNNRQKEFNKGEYIAAAFGTSIIYTGYEQYNKEQLDPSMWEDWSVTFEMKQYKEENIITKNVDIRNFYIDNECIDGIDDAEDCIWVQRESYDKFMNKGNSTLYKNIDKVAPCHFTNDYKPFINAEESNKEWDFVRTMVYRNKGKDMYVEVSNGVITREHPMISTIDGKKALPFSVRILGYKNYSIRGRGLCEPLLMFNTELNNLRELLMDWIRRSNTQVLAIGNGLSFDGRSFSYDNEILTFDGNLANNFQQISGNPPNQAIFSYLTQIYKDIAVFVGIDIQNILGEPQQTAYQTEVQREASQKRINVWLKNRDLAFERYANLMKDLLQMHAPRIYKEIEIDGQELTQWTDWPKFKKKIGKSIFQITPELLRWDIGIDCYTNTNAPTINAVDRAQKLDFLNTIWQMWQGMMMAKQAGLDIEWILPIKSVLRDLAADYNLEAQTQNTDEGQWVTAAKMDLMNQLRGMMQWWWGTPNMEQPVSPEASQAIDQVQTAAQDQSMAPQDTPTAPALAPNQPVWQ